MLIGISFNLINIRVANLKNREQEITHYGAPYIDGETKLSQWVVNPGGTTNSQSTSDFTPLPDDSRSKTLLTDSHTEKDGASAV